MLTLRYCLAALAACLAWLPAAVLVRGCWRGGGLHPGVHQWHFDWRYLLMPRPIPLALLLIALAPEDLP